MERISERDRRLILRFVDAGANNRAIANRFRITEADVQAVIDKDERDREKAEGIDRFSPAYRRMFRSQWEEATALVLRGLGRA